MDSSQNYRNFIHMTRYSRWLEDKNRRELSWDETVDRYEKFFRARPKTGKLLDFAIPFVRRQEVMPSMRAIMTAGPALERSELSGYNCSYLPIQDIQAFCESFYLLLNGSGVGFSCERFYTEQLPVIPQFSEGKKERLTIEDSKEGWVKGLKHLFDCVMEGKVPTFSFRLIRKAGSRLKTFGGRASGPEPLKLLFTNVLNMLSKAQGRKLTSLEVHDLECFIAEVVVVGGVRRAALISLSDLDDKEMRDAKKGKWWEANPQRALSNNSAVYYDGLTSEQFNSEWNSLRESGSGERGIFNRSAVRRKAAENGRDPNAMYGCNPCNEVILLPFQLCNLTEIVLRPEDTKEDRVNKGIAASILGTLQATLTNFNEDIMRTEWAINCRKEALLGTSLTGLADCPPIPDSELQALQRKVLLANKIASSVLGINPCASATNVKPSGTVSQLCDCSPGRHTRYAQYFLRNVRIDKKDPVYNLLLAQGYPVEDERSKPDSTAVVTFPLKAPEGAKTRHDFTALEQCEDWLRLLTNWAQHNVSTTIYVNDSEWQEVGEWVFRNLNRVSGMAFFPTSNHTYIQAPYDEVTEEQWNAWVQDHPVPSIDWSRLPEFEKEDETTSSQELACAGGVCML